MIKRLAALCCIALSMATVPGASPATAKTTSDPGSVWVSVGGHAEPIAPTFRCSHSANYEQRIVVDGESDMMQVASVVWPGRYEAIVYDICDGYIVYAFGSCLCNFVFVKSS